PPSVESAMGTLPLFAFRYAMKRFPYWSNERLPSQQAVPRLSPSAMTSVVHVLPPSVLKALNRPFAVSRFEMATMLLGFVLLMATDSSVWFPCILLMFTLRSVGVVGDRPPALPPQTPAGEAAANRSARLSARANGAAATERVERVRMSSSSKVGRSGRGIVHGWAGSRQAA